MGEQLSSRRALRQLRVAVQAVDGKVVEDERVGGHALHRGVNSLGQTKGFHHVKP